MIGLRAIIFDLDDTLYPEIEFVLSGFRAVAQWAQDNLGESKESSYSRLKQLFDSGIRGKTFDLWLKELGHQNPEYVSHAVQVYRDHFPRIRPYAEVPRLLRNLNAHFILGIVTDGDWRIQKRKIAALGISHYFAAIVLTDELGSDFWKPSRKSFLVALKRLGVSARSACYVGDNVSKDFLGARQVGLKTIWIRKSDGIYGGLEPPTPDHSPDFEIDSLTSLEPLLFAM